jgi:regulator of replication initiation timing
MKNNYTISPNFLLQLENDELRERIKKLISDFNELKKLCEEKEKQENEIDNDKIF